MSCLKKDLFQAGNQGNILSVPPPWGFISVMYPRLEPCCFPWIPETLLLFVPYFQGHDLEQGTPRFFCLSQSHFQNTPKRILILLKFDVKKIFHFSCERKLVVCLHLNLLTKKKGERSLKTKRDSTEHIL